MVATSSMVYEEIVGIRGSWPQPPRTLFTREMPHNLNSASANSANTGPNHQAYPQQPYHRENADGFQPEVCELDMHSLILALVRLSILGNRQNAFRRKNQWSSTRRICVARQRRSKRWYITSRRSRSSSSTTGEHSPSSCRRRYPRARRARTHWHVRSTTWGISLWRPASTSWTPSPWIIRASPEDWLTSNSRAFGNGGRCCVRVLDLTISSQFYSFWSSLASIVEYNHTLYT